MEDIVNLNSKYTIGVKCETSIGRCWMISKNDFMKLKSQEAVWSQVKLLVKQKITKFGDKIMQNYIAENTICENMDKALQNNTHVVG